MAATSSLLDSQAFPWLRDEAPEPPASCERIAFSFEYPLHFTASVFSWENLTLVRAVARRDARRRHDTIVVVDAGVANAELVDDVRRYAAFHGERIHLTDVVVLHEEALDDRLHPQSFVIAVGGGALQETVAEVASALRGVRVIRVPTTVTSQATAHQPGRLAPPFAVINDSDFLQSLSRRDIHAGMAEPLRLALSHDASLFGFIRLNATALYAGEQGALGELIRRAARVHHADPFDPPIALGEWTAQHLVEVRYGEAVALGCALDVVHSAACGVLDADALEPIISTMQSIGLPTYHPALETLPFERLRRVSVLERVGCASETTDIDRQLLLRAIDWLRHRG